MIYDIAFFLALLSIGYISGSRIEKRHYKRIREREEEFKSLPVVDLKKAWDEESIKSVKLVNGSVVISIDFFKKFLAGLINFFGGNISAYETLVDRARREAILRLKEDADDASEIINLRIETSSISKNTKNSVGAIEVLAYGTAIYR
ncbi:MAG: YbjQ family protein [Epsilonproteobacteria bacterium]|nr:YbjQ family protein [Campylobacterota bacterium]